MKCVYKRCRGLGRTRNEFGICEVCVHPSAFDPTGARMTTVFDDDRELDRAREELFEMREDPQ